MLHNNCSQGILKRPLQSWYHQTRLFSSLRRNTAAFVTTVRVTRGLQRNSVYEPEGVALTYVEALVQKPNTQLLFPCYHGLWRLNC